MRVGHVMTAGTAAAAVLVAGAGAATAAERRPAGKGCGDQRAVQRVLDRLTRVHRIPGVAVRIDDPRCGTWTGASGVADLRDRRPMRAGERGRIASVTKTFTATVLLQLAGERKVDLDAPVERYLPGVVRANGHDGRKISVRSLLRHTSGLPDHMEAFDDLEDFRWKHFEPAELVRMALARPKPTTRWHYSTTNSVLAGMIVRRVTGSRVEDEVVRRIIRPLRLRDTYWPGDETWIRGPHPRGYLREEKNGAVRWRDVTELNASAGGAGGALVSGTADVSRFFGALLGGRLLPLRLLGEMKRTVRADPDRTWPGARYGLGLMSTPLRCGGEWYGHGGHLYGWSAFGVVGPDGRRAAVMFNENTATEAAAKDELELLQTALCGEES
ncbi:serine hydrolase domain-containing protein [Actinomadura kijaniata]|uniref:serine hydrolase domain-containing protein n=1 Tax=Actinomadura kijaniata TaxID=46161 RepID=UPI001C3F4BB6|nr:serine hydrolase domain-containing protein [Actinomadura kijaniata]